MTHIHVEELEEAFWKFRGLKAISEDSDCDSKVEVYLVGEPGGSIYAEEWSSRDKECTNIHLMYIKNDGTVRRLQDEDLYGAMLNGLKKLYSSLLQCSLSESMTKLALEREKKDLVHQFSIYVAEENGKWLETFP